METKKVGFMDKKDTDTGLNSLPTELLKSLDRHRELQGFSKTETAEALGIPRSAFYKKTDPNTNDKFNELQIESYAKFLGLELQLYKRI